MTKLAVAGTPMCENCGSTNLSLEPLLNVCGDCGYESNTCDMGYYDDSAELREEVMMWREGICPAEVAITHPQYKGPNIDGCGSCPSSGDCVFEKRYRRADQPDELRLAVRKTIGELILFADAFDQNDCPALAKSAREEVDRLVSALGKER